LGLTQYPKEHDSPEAQPQVPPQPFGIPQVPGAQVGTQTDWHFPFIQLWFEPHLHVPPQPSLPHEFTGQEGSQHSFVFGLHI
jgi:hypothetical protein